MRTRNGPSQAEGDGDAAGAGSRTDADNESRSERHNQGGLCVGTDTPAKQRRGQQTLTANAPLIIAVDLGCRPCNATIERMGCSAELHDSQIEVDSWLEVTNLAGPSLCSAVCDPISATCESPPLPAGTYTLVHGDGQLALEIGQDNLELCLHPDDPLTCCADVADCAPGATCEAHRCSPTRCQRGFDCPDGTTCRDGQCQACDCPTGMLCSPDDGRCRSSDASGPSYQACATEMDCAGRLEYCLQPLGVCAAPCQTAADCGQAPASGGRVACENHDGITDNWSCVLDCTGTDSSCPSGMACVNGLFCSPGRAGGAPPPEPNGDRNCARAAGTVSAECERGDGRYYTCSCSHSSSMGDGESGGLQILADTCEQALDAAWCGP